MSTVKTLTNKLKRKNFQCKLGREIMQDYALEDYARCEIIFKIASAFHQIKMNPSDKEKTAFSTGCKKFQFKRLPFGLKGSSITWQIYITKILSQLIDKNVIVYMNDILAYEKTIHEHAQILRSIFSILREKNLKLKVEKNKLFTKGWNISAIFQRKTE